jgi:hypothetical protein
LAAVRVPEPIMGLIRVASDAEEAAEIACGVVDQV